MLAAVKVAVKVERLVVVKVLRSAIATADLSASVTAGKMDEMLSIPFLRWAIKLATTSAVTKAVQLVALMIDAMVAVTVAMMGSTSVVLMATKLAMKKIDLRKGILLRIAANWGLEIPVGCLDGIAVGSPLGSTDGRAMGCMLGRDEGNNVGELFG